MRLIENTSFEGERPLFASNDLQLKNVIFNPGESASFFSFHFFFPSLLLPSVSPFLTSSFSHFSLSSLHTFLSLALLSFLLCLSFIFCTLPPNLHHHHYHHHHHHHHHTYSKNSGVWQSTRNSSNSSFHNFSQLRGCGMKILMDEKLHSFNSYSSKHRTI